MRRAASPSRGRSRWSWPAATVPSRRPPKSGAPTPLACSSTPGTGDLLRWELAPTPTGTRLTLSHTVADRSWLSKVAAGWHICLDVAERWLDGAPIGRIVANDAKQAGWDPLNAAYGARFGVG